MFKQAFFSFTYPSISRNVRTHAPYKEVKKGSVRQNKINSTFFYHQEKPLRFREPKEPSSYEEVKSSFAAVKRFQKMERSAVHFLTDCRLKKKTSKKLH